MFALLRDEQQHSQDSKPVQVIKEIANGFGMDKLVEPTTLVNIHNSLREQVVDS